MRHGLVPVTELFRGGLTLFMRKRIPVAVAVLVFAMLLALGSAVVQRKLAVMEDGMAAEQSMTLEDFQKKTDESLAAMSKMSFDQFLAASQSNPPSADVQMGTAYLRRVFPVLLLQIAWNLFVLYLTTVFFLLLFTRGDDSPYDVAAALPLMAIRMIGLGAWMLVRSLIWIPFVGLFIFVYMFPRLCIAPVLLAGGETTIFESLHESMRRTSGRWAPVFLRLLTLIVATLFILWPILVVITAISLFSFKIAFIVWLCAIVAILAFHAAFMTVLAVLLG